jgi:hypothetical protein
MVIWFNGRRVGRAFYIVAYALGFVALVAVKAMYPNPYYGASQPWGWFTNFIIWLALVAAGIGLMSMASTVLGEKGSKKKTRNR